MRAAVSSSLALLLGLGLGVVLSARALLSVATSSEAVLASVDTDRLRGMAVQAVAADLLRMEMIATLEESPLELRRTDLVEILRRTFDRRHLEGKARQVHGGLVRHLREAPPDAPFRISVAAEAPMLLEALREHLSTRLEELPPCPPSEDLEILWESLRERLEAGSDRQEILRQLPRDCRPPEPVRSELVSGLEEEFASARREAPDSVRAFPAEGRSGPGYERAMRLLNRADLWVARAGWRGVGLFAAGLILLAALHRSEPRVAVERIGICLGVGSVLCAIGGVLLMGDGDFARYLFGGGNAAPEPERRWLELAAYAIERTAESAGRGALAGAALLGVSVVALTMASRSGAARRGPPDAAP